MRAFTHRVGVILVSCLIMLALGSEPMAASDRTPPSVAITSPSSFIVGTINVTGTASDNSSVKKVDVSVEGVTPYTLATPVASGNWSSWSLATQLNNPGTYRVLARATDRGGNVATASVFITVDSLSSDTSPPTVSISWPVQNGTVATGSISIQGASSDAAGSGVTRVDVSVDGGAFSLATPAATGNWSTWTFVTTLSTDGTHQVSVRATDRAENVSLLSSVSFNSVQPSVDRFGIRKLHETKAGGEEWFFTSPTDPRFLPQTTMTANPDGSYKVKATQVRLGVLTTSGYHPEWITTYNQTQLVPKGFMQSSNDWRDVEITAYVKLNRDANDNFAWYARGGKHNDSNNGCEGTAYKGHLHFSGLSRFAKEQWHSGGYSFTPYIAATSSLLGRWIGFKTLIYNLQENGKTVVKMENWIDNQNNNQWTKIDEYVDRGGWGAEGTHCGGAPDQIMSWAGPIATFRWDTTNDVDIKFMSVREILP